MKTLVDSSVLLQAPVRIEMAAFWGNFDGRKHLFDAKWFTDTTVLNRRKTQKEKMQKKAGGGEQISKKRKPKPAFTKSARAAAKNESMTSSKGK